jgi:hypothetical protein
MKEQEQVKDQAEAGDMNWFGVLVVSVSAGSGFRIGNAQKWHRRRELHSGFGHSSPHL